MNPEGLTICVTLHQYSSLDKGPLKIQKKKDSYPVENKGKIYELTKEEIQMAPKYIKGVELQ